MKELPGHVQVSHLRLLPLKCGAVSSARWGDSGCEQGPQGSEWVEKGRWRGSQIGPAEKPRDSGSEVSNEVIGVRHIYDAESIRLRGFMTSA